MLSYATGIGEAHEQYRGIHTPQFLGYILVFLEHAARIMSALGLSTSIHLEVLLQGVRGVPWIYLPSGAPEHGSCSELDDTVAFTLSTTTDVLTQSRDLLARDILRLVFFAMNRPGTADVPERLTALVQAGYQYNEWHEPTTTSK